LACVGKDQYRKALSIAAEQGAKLWELRAAASLARLRRDQGHRAEARDLLAPVYGWFTAGFDTPDLKELLQRELGQEFWYPKISPSIIAGWRGHRRRARQRSWRAWSTG
jgi:hypothetical protein